MVKGHTKLLTTSGQLCRLSLDLVLLPLQIACVLVSPPSGLPDIATNRLLQMYLESHLACQQTGWSLTKSPNNKFLAHAL